MKAVRRCIALLAVAAILATGAAIAQPRTVIAVDGEALRSVTDPVEMGAWLRRLMGSYTFDGHLEVVYEDKGKYYSERRCGQLPPKPEQQENPPTPPEPLCRSIKGVGDCIGIGNGPGVQCMLRVEWQDLYEVVHSDPDDPLAPVGVFTLPGGVSNLSPAMALFGIDPGAAGIHYLLVDSKGIPEGGRGFIKGNKATITTTCVNTPALLNGMRLTMTHELVGSRVVQNCDKVTYFEAKPDSEVVFITVDMEINGESFTRMQMTLRRSPVKK